MLLIKRNQKPVIAMGVMLVIAVCLIAPQANAAADTDLEEGNYEVEVSLSAYISAMGGVEFGDGIVSGDAKVVVDANGDYTMTVYFTTSSVNIYSMSVNTFVDATDSAPGYYDASGVKNDAVYTLSSNTAEDANGKKIHYVDSMTFTLDEIADSYTLYLYINSSVMGVQFCDGSGSGSSNSPGVDTPYVAKLSVNWDTAAAGASETTSASSSVVLDYTDSDSSDDASQTQTVTGASGQYEVTIPATIDVDEDTLTGSYSVTAEDFDLDTDAYVTVETDASGVLTSGDNSVSFTNKLASGRLEETGDSLSGKITVTDEPAEEGEYSGTVNFTIKYYE